ncbi:MAG: hypothetical protein U5L09_07680 [Bacteroidales bacterium]|nr:hypothetical protein [Bacteroidales bacterium]
MVILIMLNNTLSIPASSSMDDIYTSEEYLYIVGSSSITVEKDAQIINTFDVSGVDFSDFSFDNVNQKAYFFKQEMLQHYMSHLKYMR